MSSRFAPISCLSSCISWLYLCISIQLLGGVERYIFPYFFLLLLCKTFALLFLLLLLLFSLGRYFVDFSIAQKVLQANFLWILFCLIIGYGHTAFAIVFSDFWGAKLLTWLQSKKSNSIDFAFGDSSIFNLRPPAVFGMCQRVKQKFSSFCQIPLASPSIYISFPSTAVAAAAVVFISFVTFALVYASVRLKNASLVLWGRGKGLKCMWFHWLFFFSSLLLVNSCNAAVVHKQRGRKKMERKREWEMQCDLLQFVQIKKCASIEILG